eukprot:CFRG5445T1
MSLEALRATWELPYVAIFLRTFHSVFSLPNLESEKLEQCLQNPTDNAGIIEDLIVKLLTPFTSKKKIESYDEALIKEISLIYPDCDYLNYLEDNKFVELDAVLQLSIIRLLCDMRVHDANDVLQCLKGVPADLLRHDSIGMDKEKSRYYYFQDSRLWREKKNPKKRKAPDIWELVCSNADEWEAFANTLNKRFKHEKALYEIVHDELLPDLLEQEANRRRIEEAREKAERKRLQYEMMPRRVSRRVQQKMEEEAREEEQRLEEELRQQQIQELERIEIENDAKEAASRETRYKERQDMYFVVSSAKDDETDERSSREGIMTGSSPVTNVTDTDSMQDKRMSREEGLETAVVKNGNNGDVSVDSVQLNGVESSEDDFVESADLDTRKVDVIPEGENLKAHEVAGLSYESKMSPMAVPSKPIASTLETMGRNENVILEVNSNEVVRV